VWTLDELLDRVRVTLGEAEYPGAPNGRVRDVPDRRAVRWYATTGLVDRPLAMRGRHALYGPRHLLQLVALKRRQADGRSLAQIQAELAGATDATLAAIAGVPDDLLPVGDTRLLPVGDTRPEVAPPRTRFWAAASMAAPLTAAPPPVASAAEPPVVPAAPPPVVSAAEPPVVSAAPPPVVPAALPAAAAASAAAATLAGVPLPGGAVLLLPVHPGPADLAAIGAAAQPLLDLLADRGLLTNSHPRSSS
jgi:DNA-binding transcriptional MerR regulator